MTRAGCLNGRYCTFTRTVEKNSIRATFAGFCKNLADQIEEKQKSNPSEADRMRQTRPTLSGFIRAIGGRHQSSFETIQDKGVVEKENPRTVWIRFNHGSASMKVKKSRVQIS